MAPHWTGDEFRDRELERQDRLKEQAKEDNATVAAENEAARVGADLSELEVEGTGKDDRVTKADVTDALEDKPESD